MGLWLMIAERYAENVQLMAFMITNLNTLQAYYAAAATAS